MATKNNIRVIVDDVQLINEVSCLSIMRDTARNDRVREPRADQRQLGASLDGASPVSCPTAQ